MNINAILLDWKCQRLTIGEIRKRHNLTREQAFAICECSGGLCDFEIRERLGNLWAGESAASVKTAMSYRWSFAENMRIIIKQAAMAKDLKSFRILRVAFKPVPFAARSLFFEPVAMKGVLTIAILLGVSLCH